MFDLLFEDLFACEIDGCMNIPIFHVFFFLGKDSKGKMQSRFMSSYLPRKLAFRSSENSDECFGNSLSFLRSVSSRGVAVDMDSGCGGLF